jgi:hypothetical protein
MNNTDKEVTFGTIKRTRKRNTNDLSDEQHELRQKIQHGYLSGVKQPTVNVKVNGFRNKKQFSYNLPLR